MWIWGVLNLCLRKPGLYPNSKSFFILDQKFYFFPGTATRLSIRRGRSNSRAYKYSLAVHEPEIQACNSPISGQDAIEECNEAEDDVGELEQVKQLGGEKTESFFTR